MIPFDAMETMARERRGALLAEADDRRLARAARGSADRGFAARMSARWTSFRHPSPSAGVRPALWGWRVLRPAAATPETAPTDG
jgi:hypothetical protein